MRSLSREIINLTAILNLPKGTEHFMSDIHGEYEAFCHILNNCSGVVREKVDMLLGGTLSAEERGELCTLIYYPKEKLRLLRKSGEPDRAWY
ncbi:MAG: fructose-bisphosphatase class III, partial [Ruminococcus sp.]|nr:fructose-bisphosphatase class III [Ruminococcus sp.]